MESWDQTIAGQWEKYQVGKIRESDGFHRKTLAERPDVTADEVFSPDMLKETRETVQKKTMPPTTTHSHALHGFQISLERKKLCRRVAHG